MLRDVSEATLNLLLHILEIPYRNLIFEISEKKKALLKTEWHRSRATSGSM
jgi:hypothetical protein